MARAHLDTVLEVLSGGERSLDSLLSRFGPDDVAVVAELVFAGVVAVDWQPSGWLAEGPV